MRFLDWLFGRLGAGRSPPPPPEHAVFVFLDTRSLPEEVYRDNELETLEDQLIDAITAAKAGVFDGNEVGPEEATLFMYGPDAERLYAAIEPVLRAYPLCKNARVRIRAGGPGVPF